MKKTTKICVLCMAAGRRGFNTHWLCECMYLPEADCQAVARTYRVANDEYDDDGETHQDDIPEHSDEYDPLIDALNLTHRVNIFQSPHITAQYGHNAIKITMDCGATSNLINITFAHRLGFPLMPVCQGAHQADGRTPMSVLGETHIFVSRGKWSFQLDALVVKELDIEFLADMPFLSINNIAISPMRKQIVIKGSEIVTCGDDIFTTQPSIRRAQSFRINSPNKPAFILPGGYLELCTPVDIPPDATLALEPRFDSKIRGPPTCWPEAQEVAWVGNHIHLINNANDPVIIPKHAHVWQVHPAINLTCDNHDPSPQTAVLPPSPQPNNLMLDNHDGLFSNTVTVNPDNLLSSTRTKPIIGINKAYDKVFSTEVPMHNGRSGNIQGMVNMGPTYSSKERAISTLPTWQISRTAGKVWQFRVFAYTEKARGHPSSCGIPQSIIPCSKTKWR